VVVIHYSKTIKSRRERRLLTQTELSELLNKGHTNDRISKWENGHIRPSRKSAIKLAEVLGGEAYEYRFEETE